MRSHHPVGLALHDILHHVWIFHCHIRQMSLRLVLVFVPADDCGEGSLHDSGGRPVGPLGAEHEDLARLLHVLLVHRRLLL